MSQSPGKPLVIVGVSARAAAFSALRAKLDPFCADRFADADLRRKAYVRRTQLEPQQLLELLHGFPEGPWIYTGGLENRPALVSQIARERPLYGNRADILSRVRDPAKWTRSLREASLAVPNWQSTADGLPPDGSWLRKSRHGSGGWHVRRWNGQDRGSRDKRSWYFQKHVDGKPASAVYVAGGGQARLLGVTEQVTGCSWCRASAFAYAGSLGPLRLEQADRERFELIGTRLVECFGLVGLFGVDAIIADDGVWPVEINPRYPASVEVLERALGIRAMEIHVRACSAATLPEGVPQVVDRWCGKAIVYARESMIVGGRFVESRIAECGDRTWPPFADIPAAGSQIRCGQPLMTVLTRRKSRAELVTALRHGVARIERDLYGN